MSLLPSTFPLVRRLFVEVARHHCQQLLRLVAVVCAVSVINASLPSLLGKIVGALSNLDRVQYWLVLLVALFLTKVGLQYLLSASTHFLSQSFAFRLREKLTIYTIKAPPSLVETLPQGEVYHTVFIELGSLQAQLIFGTLYAAKNLLFLVVLASCLLRLSPFLFIDLVAFLLVWHTCVKLLGARLERVNGLWQRHNASFLSYFAELLTGKSDIFIFRLEARIFAQVAKVTAQLKRLSAMQAAYTGTNASLTELLLGAYLLSVVAIIHYSQLSTATAVTGLGYLFMLLMPARELNEYAVSVFALRPSLARTEAYLRQLWVPACSPNQAVVLPMTLAASAPPLALIAQHLHFGYAASLTPSVADFSYTFTPGLYLITGRNGAGKSTLLKLLAGLLQPETGQVVVRAAGWAAADAVKLVQQQPFLFYGTILDNLQLVHPASTPEAIVATARRYGIYSVFDALPQKLLTVVGENGKSISGGEKQLISVLRGLLLDPPILLLDEITSNLSPLITQALLAGISRHRAGKITIIVSHQALEGIAFDHQLNLDCVNIIAPHYA